MQTSNIAELRKITNYINIKRNEVKLFVTLLSIEKLVSNQHKFFVFTFTYIQIFEKAGKTSLLP